MTVTSIPQCTNANPCGFCVSPFDDPLPDCTCGNCRDGRYSAVISGINAEMVAYRQRNLSKRERKRKGKTEPQTPTRTVKVHSQAAESATEPDGGLDAFTKSFENIDIETKLPAVLQRSDGETLLYAGKLNSVFGTPGSGKSWIALIMAEQTVHQGGRVLWWDFEDSPATFKRRAALLGFDPVSFKDDFRFVIPDLIDAPNALSEAQAWLCDAIDPNKSLVVIDAAESAGCPSDGASVGAWFNKYVDIWRDYGIGVLTLDHVPKRAEDRPKGAIGSQHKLARLDGAGLFVTGTVWTKRTGGKMKLIVHKDRGGDIPAPVGKTAAIIEGTYNHEGAFSYAIKPPDQTDDPEGLADALLEAIAQAGEVKGSRGLRSLTKAKGRAVDESMRSLVDAGLVGKVKDGKSFAYTITSAGLASLASDES